MNKPCVMSGCLNYVGVGVSRCPEHELPEKPRDPRYDSAWGRHSRQVRREWVAENGNLCPGWQVPAHPSTDLVLDHDVGVLCRVCNGVKGGGHDKRRRNRDG